MLPILYSFCRCPYAIRARLALNAAGINYELREVKLRCKPESMLTLSPKGSVPVLVKPDGHVIDESWEIMLWALHQHDPEAWLGQDGSSIDAASKLVAQNDTIFKGQLDRYKYPDRYPEHTQSYYRTQAEAILQDLEIRLRSTPYLLGSTLSIADAGLFPFIRQFAGVDKNWFDHSPYPKLKLWLNAMLNSDRFVRVMKKYPPWQPDDIPLMITNKAHTHATPELICDEHTEHRV